MGPVPFEATADFLRSYEWRRLRMKVLRARGARCEACGATPAHGARMNVDHVKPRRTRPDLALCPENLQVLCDACNHGKGNDDTDWRRSAPTRKPTPRPASALLPAERYLLAAILDAEAGAHIAVLHLEAVDIEGLRSAPILLAAKDLAGRGVGLSAAALMGALHGSAEGQRLLGEVSVAGAPGKGPAARECVRELKRRPLQARMAQLQRELGGASGPQLMDLLEEKLHLRRALAGP